MMKQVTKKVAQKMSASEALVETLVAHNIKVFGIVGSAFIDPLDLFPAAGIEFVDVQHEQNAVHIADSYARLTGKPPSPLDRMAQDFEYGHRYCDSVFDTRSGLCHKSSVWLGLDRKIGFSRIATTTDVFQHNEVPSTC